MTLQILGRVYWELGRFTDGLKALGPAVTFDKRAGYRDGRAMMLDTIARINVERGRHDEGLEQAERALAMVKDVGRIWIQAAIPPTIAAAHRKLARPDLALHADEQALALARKGALKRAEADSRVSLSLTHQQLGRHDEARAYAEQALRLARDHSFRVVEGQALTALLSGVTAQSGTPRSEEAHAAAVELGRKALSVHRETGHRLGEARTLMALARVVGKTDSDAAARMRQQAGDVFSAIGVPRKEYEDRDA